VHWLVTVHDKIFLGEFFISLVGCSQTSLSVIGMASGGALSFGDQFCKLPKVMKNPEMSGGFRSLRADQEPRPVCISVWSTPEIPPKLRNS
jgi:hypothetical protein